MLDLVFMHADIGFKAYRPLAENMVASFKGKVPCRAVQFADMTSEPIQGADVLHRAEINAQNMMAMRPKMLRDVVQKANGDIVLSDADMIWQKDPTPLFDEPFDVGLIWRAQCLSMPYLGCLILLRQGSEGAREFVTDWFMACVSMPKELQSWWGDQFALASLVGRQYPNTAVTLRGVKIKIFDAGDIVGTMHTKEQEVSPRVYVKHYKGAPAKDLKFRPLEAA